MTKSNLIQRIKNGEVKVGDYVDFTPLSAYCMMTSEETGVWNDGEKGQYFMTERLKFQYAGMLKGKILLLSDGVTQKKICFAGDVGNTKGSQVLQRIAKTCWSNKLLEAEGYVLTYFDFKKLPEEVKKTKAGDHRYWLASSGSGTGVKGNYSGLNYVNENEKKDQKLIYISDMLYGKDSSFGTQQKSEEFPIRPAVLISCD